MVSLFSNPTLIHLPKLPLPCRTRTWGHRRRDRTCKLLSRGVRFSANAVGTSSSEPNYPMKQQPPPPRTLFPGGFKRPEIKVPTLVLQVSSEEVLERGVVLDSIDLAVSKWVRVVVLDSSDGSGGRLYEAACLLKSVIKDRAYLLIAERVDIAAAVGASGVVLSDQGLPALVARNMMMESKSEYVVLPLVARNVQTENAALSASNSEGADFLIYSIDKKEYAEVPVSSVIRNVKIPVFTTIALLGEDAPFTEASKLLQSGASGLAVSLEDMKLFSNDALSKLFSSIIVMSRRMEDDTQNFNKFDKKNRSHGRKGFAGFIKLEDREKHFIEMERTVLLEAISAVQKAAPLVIV